MSYSEKTIIYDDDEVRVIWSPGTSDFALITFGDLITPAKDLRFFADTPLEKSGISAIGVMAKRGNWFPSKNLQKAADVILKKIRGYKTRLTYGGSMGGYAAIKFSRILDATQVIALCPQWSIDPEECDGVNPGWGDYFTPAMRSMGIRETDVSGEIFIFSDPFDTRDMFHYRKIVENYTDAHFIGVPMVGHHVTSVFAGTNNLRELIDGCRLRKLADLYRFSRHTRKGHVLYQDRILEHAMRNFPHFGSNYLSNVSRRDLLRKNRRYFPQILSHLMSTVSVERAIAFYEENYSLLSNASEQHMICAYLSCITGRQTSIVTAHQSRLIYDFSKEHVIHKTTLLAEWEVLVEAELLGSTAKLFVMVGGTKFYLSRTDGDHLGILGVSGIPKQEASMFELSYGINGCFAIHHGGKYFCAEKGGKIVCNREVARDWEMFRFKPIV